MDNLDQLVKQALEAVEKAQTVQELDQVRVDFLGKKGQITQQLKHWVSYLRKKDLKQAR